MKFVYPMKDLTVIEELKSALLHQSYRNYFFFVMAISSGIDSKNLLPLKIKDIKNKGYIYFKEVKYEFNDVLKQEILRYTRGMKPDDYLFLSREGESPKPLTRGMIDIFLKEAAKTINLNSNVSFLTLRKTFAWFHYQENHDIKYLQELLRQPSPNVTRKYLGLEPK